MKKYLFLLIALLLFIPSTVLAVTDLSQKDFDKAKKGNNSKGIAFSKEYNNFYFENDGEYRLVTDITLENTIVVNEADPELILDLNGKTLSYRTSEDDMNWFISCYVSKFTIKGKGTIKSNSKMKYILVGTEESDIILDGCNIQGRIGIDGSDNKEKLTIKSGTFGSLSAVNADIIIDDSNFNSNFLDREALVINNDVNLVINDGSFESKYGAIKCDLSPDKYNTTTITINGGTFIGSERHGLTLGGHEKLIINSGTFKDDNDTIVITKDDKTNIDKLISSSIVKGTINVTDGNNIRYNEGKDNDLSITIDKSYDTFVYEGVIYGSVYVDNKILNEEDFTFSGNTTITLKKEFMDTLSAGDHTLVAISGYGDYATVSFYVKKKTNPIVFITLVGACVVIGGIAIYFKNKKSK